MNLTEEKEEWEELLRSPAWKRLETMMQEQAGGRVNQIVMSPLETADSVFNQEFMKGEVAALRLVSQLPQLQIQQLESDIKTANLTKESE